MRASSFKLASGGTAAPLSVSYAYSDQGRFKSVQSALNGTTNTFAYNYLPDSDLIESMVSGSITSSKTYEPNRNLITELKNMFGTTTISKYNYTNYTGPSGSITATHDAQDRLLTYGSSTYRYTANGTLTNKTEGGQSTAFDYDPFGNLLSVDLPNGDQIAYIIDTANRRVGRKVNGTRTQSWLYKDALNPVAELDGSNNVVASFIYGTSAFVPDYMIKGTSTYRIISDHVGSVRLVVDVATGNVIQRMDYNEFGVVLQDTNPGFQPFGFQGGLYDLATGLVRFGARDYDPAIGRWLSKDPIMFDGGLNQYVFCGNNPVNYRDPLGLCEDEGPGFRELWGNSLNNTVSAVNYSFGQGLYDLSTLDWHGDQWNDISDLMWSTDTPAAPQATPYIATALGVSAGATAVAAGDIYSQLPPRIQYGIIDAIVNGLFNMEGGADPVRPDPTPPPPIEAPPIP